MNKVVIATLFALTLIFTVSCSKTDGEKTKTSSGTDPHAGHAHAEGHEHEDHGRHGGEVIELGTAHATHLEFLHDEKAGKVTLHTYGKDLKSPLAIPVADAPSLKINSDSGQKEIKTKAVDEKDGKASAFEATDEAFKSETFGGRISITIDGKTYNPDIPAEHGHDHGHGHK